MAPLLRTTAAILCLTFTPAWSDEVLATYWANSGSLPPEYAWEVTVTISEAGKVTLKRCKGYETEGPACTLRTGKAKEAQLAAIRQAATESGLLETPAQEAPPEEIPLGGGSTGGSVTLEGQTVTLLAYPRAEDAARVARVLSAIYAAIPARLAKRFIEGN
jgi:hypothetical protein